MPDKKCACGHSYEVVRIVNGLDGFGVCYFCWHFTPITLSRVVTCDKCGSPNVVAVNFDHNISLCAACLPPFGGMCPPQASLPVAPQKVGCKKCNFTGFAYGKIPCVCTET
jgi:hypothetical protein